MQSKTTWGVRHLLVSTGVISLVLSVAAPAALAGAETKGKSEEKTEQGGHTDNGGTGTTRVLVCHNGAVLEVDDDGGDLGGHGKHGDTFLGLVGDESSEVLAAIEVCDGTPGEILDGDEVVDVCRNGVLVQVLESAVLEGDVDPVRTDDDELTCPGEIVGGGDKVEVCHQGEVIEIAAEALEEHLGHGDAEMVEDVTCPAVIIDEEIEVEIDIDPVVVEVPVKTPPATPVQPIPAAQPRPVVTISADTITKPVAEQNEVLGAVTTRTPTPGVGALDPGAHTAASITALAATGADGTKVLAAAGAILLLSGFGLQVSGRRRMRPAAVEA